MYQLPKCLYSYFHTFRKRLSFIYECFFPVSILNIIVHILSNPQQSILIFVRFKHIGIDLVNNFVFTVFFQTTSKYSQTEINKFIYCRSNEILKKQGVIFDFNNISFCHIFKVGLLPSKKVVFICFNESPLKMIKIFFISC